MLFEAPSILMMKYQRSLKGIDPITRLTPPTAVATSPTDLVITGTLPAKTLPDHIACSRAKSSVVLHIY